MLDSKFFFTLIGLIVAVFAICNTNMSPAINEGWNGINPRKLRVYREVHPKGPDGKATCGAYSLQNNYQAMLGTQKFLSYPNFQSKLSPRFSNVQYGSNISYNMPSINNQGSPCEPFGDMAKENYTNGNTRENFCASGTCGGGCDGGCGVPKCNKNGSSLGSGSYGSLPSISHDSNYTSTMNQLRDSEYNTEVISDGLITVDDMTSINSMGEVENPIVVDRLMYTNMSSRLYAAGDPIRGDLAITPCLGNWFSVHPNPATDLQTGAMSVLGGFDNENAKAMAELVSATSAGYQTTAGGINVNMGNSYETTLHNAGGDITVAAFV